jgi:hypothetical protein
MQTGKTVFRMNYSQGFDLQDGPPDLNQLFQSIPIGSAQDYPNNMDGSILSSSLELHTFGYAFGQSNVIHQLSHVVVWVALNPWQLRQ